MKNLLHCCIRVSNQLDNLHDSRLSFKHVGLWRGWIDSSGDLLNAPSASPSVLVLQLLWTIACSFVQLQTPQMCIDACVYFHHVISGLLQASELAKFPALSHIHSLSNNCHSVFKHDYTGAMVHTESAFPMQEWGNWSQPNPWARPQWGLHYLPHFFSVKVFCTSHLKSKWPNMEVFANGT